MAKAAVTPSQPYRPFNFVFALVFALFSGAATWFMRVQTVIEGIPVDFDAPIEIGFFPNGVQMKKTYTGIKSVDIGCSYLVAAFLAGPAGWDEGVRLQQIHFLANFLAVICIWNVEACRKRNAGRLISFTAFFALFYQTVGGAVIIPLYYVAYVYSSSPDSYLKSGRSVPLGYAKALLPAIVLGYIVPTVALYIPWGDIDTIQGLTALWQVSPLFPNILLLVLAPLLSRSSSSSSTRSSGTEDVKYLKRIYFVCAVVCTITQAGTLYTCLTSSNPQLSLSYVFLPSTATWKQSSTLGLHWIFQWDWLIIGGSSLVWAGLTVVDTIRALDTRVTVPTMILSVASLLLVSIVAGPGTTMALVWNWREDRLIMIEQGVRGTAKKPKVA